MSKRQFKSQASSGRVGNGSFGGGAFGGSGFGATSSSVLSYVQEPPDYSIIHNSNDVVAFKNLSKKDGTTKAKALEDLQTSTSGSDVSISDGFLEIWAKLFPRLSIDSTRRVRQLSHVLNGNICSKSGKRIVKHMPRIAGSWLAGTFDNDRVVARAAADGLHLVFPSPEKIHGVRKTFQRSLMEYCRDALLLETVGTLSDERTISSDDANATYARVVSTAFSLINDLISDLDHEERQKAHDLYSEILTDTKFWNFASDADPAVRRSLYRLIATVLGREPSTLEDNVKVISTALLYKGLQADQSTSAHDYVLTLTALTSALPSLWTEAYTAKKPALARLRNFLKKGSQSSKSDYWSALKDLYSRLPSQILPHTKEDATELMEAARTGVCKKEERFNAASAWQSYFALVHLTTSHLSENVEHLLDAQAMPIITQFVFPTSETESWSVSGARSASTVSSVASIKAIKPLLENLWPRLANQLTEVAKVSQPEQSKDFDRSQLQVAAAGERFAILQKQLWERCGELQTESPAAFATASSHLLDDCISLVKTRNGKPYGAAAIIEQLLRNSAQELLAATAFADSYQNFAQQDLPGLIFSPSQRQLVHGLYAASANELFSSAFAKVIESVLDKGRSTEEIQSALRTIFSSSIPEKAINIARGNNELQQLFTAVLTNWNSEDGSMFLTDLIRSGAVRDSTIDSIVSSLVTSLGVEDQSEASLSTIDQLSKTDEIALRKAVGRSSVVGDQLLPRLLRLEQSSDDNVADKATSLVAQLSSAISESTPDAKFSIIIQNLEKVSHESLSINSVLDLTRRLLGPDGRIEKAGEVLPDLSIWRKALEDATELPQPSLALLSPLGGVVHLLKDKESRGSGKASYDAEGYSQALRIATYVSLLITEFKLMDNLEDQIGNIVALLHVTMQVAEDSLSISGANGLWKPSGAGSIEPAVLELTTDVNQGIGGYLDSWATIVEDDREQSRSFFAALTRLFGDTPSLSPTAYYAALSSTKVKTNLAETHGVSSKDSTKAEEILKAQRSSGELLPQMTILVGLQQALAGTALLNRYCNELVADLTDIEITGRENEGLQKMVILNCILRTQEDAASSIAKPRLIFLVKRLIPWLSAETMLSTKAEVCKMLTELLPAMADMYGEHWEQTLDFLSSYWNSPPGRSDSAEADEAEIVLQHASLRLLARLKRLAKFDEPNDDLVDAMKDKRDSLRDGLLNLLHLADDKSDEGHQPLMLTHELLARQLASMPPAPLKDTNDLYPLMYAPSRAVQQATFDILHQQIPAAQEQISFDAALDNKTAQLPDELLSLILEAPTLDSLVDESFDRSMPRSLQGYLFSWRLIFDHFNGSSYMVKGDYIEQLKDGPYIPDLLGFTFDFLGHTRGKPVDASKFDIQEYTADSESSPEKDVQWLLTHIYYLALTHLPSLVKSYYLDIRSRQTSLAVESWTAKYISPLITTNALKDVAEWSEKSVKDDPDYENMAVKVGSRSKEINVGYVVDEQTMAIRVVLPEAYPLASAQVHGITRVAVKEEKWQSWLRNCQGVITFSNGSITDGLTAWRKNVTGALKGQSECAICYSLISADKQLPTKRCQTCKNLFHSSCLLKWFKTSNASTCPLCRTAFNFN